MHFAGPYGLLPGDPYSSLDQAGMQAVNDINPQSISENREYAGLIYQNPFTGAYSYSAPNQGGAHDSSPGILPIGGIPVGDYHTHGATSPPYDDQHFSPTDKEWNDRSGWRGFLGTPSGDVKKYDPGTGITENLTQGTCE